MTEEWIENGGYWATIATATLEDEIRIEKKKHLSLIIYPMKYTYHDGGCEWTELGYSPN